jgi:hypothetical protein
MSSPLSHPTWNLSSLLISSICIAWSADITLLWCDLSDDICRKHELPSLLNVVHVVCTISYFLTLYSRQVPQHSCLKKDSVPSPRVWNQFSHINYNLLYRDAFRHNSMIHVIKICKTFWSHFSLLAICGLKWIYLAFASCLCVSR